MNRPKLFYYRQSTALDFQDKTFWETKTSDFAFDKGNTYLDLV